MCNPKNPTFSIITINYNNKNGLEKTIKSVIEQTCTDYEYIIIDGGSNDGSKELIEKNNKYFKYWVSEPDKGIFNAMNKGVAVASGKYCLFMNSGDCIASADVLAFVKKEIESHPADFMTGDIQFSQKNYYGDCGLRATEEASLPFFFKMSLPHQSTFIKTEWLNKIPYDETYKIAGDWKQTTESLILNNATYRPINGKVIAYYDVTGISATNIQLLKEEKDKILHEWFPPKVLEVLEKYSRRSEYILIDKERYPKIFSLLNFFRRIKDRLFG